MIAIAVLCAAAIFAYDPLYAGALSKSTLNTAEFLKRSISDIFGPDKVYNDSAKITLASQSVGTTSKVVHEFHLEHVPEFKQKNSAGCWATTVAMMQSWKIKKFVEPRSLAAEAGPKWLQIYEENTGLPESDKAAFLNEVGLVYEAPMSYMREAVEDMLRKFGPLWFTVGDQTTIMTHANLLFGISYLDDGRAFVYYIDPADGLRHTEEYGSFMQRYEGAAYMYNDLYMEALVNGSFVGAQVVHFPENR